MDNVEMYKSIFTHIIIFYTYIYSSLHIAS